MKYNPANLLFTASHEWVYIDGDIQGDIAVVGISQFAINQITDVLHIDLIEVNRVVTKGQSIGDIEGIKAVSDVFAPVAGAVIEVNEIDIDAFRPYDDWLVKIRIADRNDLRTLMSHDDYHAKCTRQT